MSLSNQEAQEAADRAEQDYDRRYQANREQRFGQGTLQILERDKNWSADTLQDIAFLARDLGLKLSEPEE